MISSRPLCQASFSPEVKTIWYEWAPLTGRNQPQGTYQYPTQKGEIVTSLLCSKKSVWKSFQTATGFVHFADKEEACDPVGQMCYMEACEKLQVVPAFIFLRHMQSSEVPMMHRGLGPEVL